MLRFLILSFLVSGTVANLVENDLDMFPSLVSSEPSLPYWKVPKSTRTFFYTRSMSGLRSPAAHIMKNYVDICMDKAVRLWSPVINVNFEETDSDDADIKVFFYSLEHGDMYPFDGEGGEVGHSFYPEERKRGEIHIDDDEPWGPDSRNLEWVLAHEMGHALGIPHQKGPSLMEFGYRGYRNTPKLTLIDRLAARRMYRA